MLENMFNKTLQALENQVGLVVDRAPGFLSRPLYGFYENRLRQQFKTKNLPSHVAVLADGNRRWARSNAPGQPLEAGYRAGADKLQQFVCWCKEINIPIVTLWVLSTDNLKRSQDDELLPLLEVIENLVNSLSLSEKVKLVGDLSLLPEKTAAALKAASEQSVNNQGMHVNVAVSYGGRHELISAFKSLLVEQAAKGMTLEDVAQTLTLEQISEHLYTRGQPDPDLIIRTSGEQRLSGFLLWQSAHSEFYFCEALWPDFRRVDFYRALRSYSQRERRFGR